MSNIPYSLVMVLDETMGSLEGHRVCSTTRINAHPGDSDLARSPGPHLPDHEFRIMSSSFEFAIVILMVPG